MPAESKKEELFERIESSLIEVLKENLSVPKENIMSGVNVDFSKKKLALPQISLNNTGFTVGEIGIGSDAGVKKEETSDAFTGDGKTFEFKLSKEPHSLVNVKLKEKKDDKWKIIKDVDDREHFDNFTFDCKKGVITFRAVPKAGTEIRVNYCVNGDFSETKGLKFNLNYDISVFAESNAEVNNVCTSIIKILLLERIPLAGNGILTTLTGGESMDELTDNVYGKKLKYLIETELIVEFPQLRKIGEIDVRRKNEEKR
jgi:hypothetical protein